MMRRRLIALGITLAVIIPRASAEERVGVLVIAHGGNSQWDATVRKTVRQANLEMPTDVAFGMAMHRHELREFQDAVNKLQRKGLSRLVVIPLLVSSHSEVYRQYEYVLGLRKEAEWPEVQPLEIAVPVVLGRGLDESDVVAEVLLERAKTLSRGGDRETVILVAHGPVADADNERWLAAMQPLAQHIKEAGQFHDVLATTIRDDAPEAVREQATQALRDLVRAHGEAGRVLVVPVLLARGGIERKIPKILSGLTCVYRGETLLPHPKVAEWIAQQAQRLAVEPPTKPGTPETAVLE